MHIKYIKANQLEEMNLVNKANHVVPTYDLSKKKVHTEFYLSSKRELALIGRIDNNYVCWLSISTIDDKQLNAKVFNAIVNEKHPYVSTSHKILGDRYDEVKGWMKGEIVRTNVGGMLWNTPFGHYYGTGNMEEHGNYFAKDILHYYDRQQTLCEIRFAEGAYEEILKSYLKILRKEDCDYLYYEKMRPLISILKYENYLILSPDQKMRTLYKECLNEIARLYDKYMTMGK